MCELSERWPAVWAVLPLSSDQSLLYLGAHVTAARGYQTGRLRPSHNGSPMTAQLLGSRSRFSVLAVLMAFAITLASPLVAPAYAQASSGKTTPTEGPPGSTVTASGQQWRSGEQMQVLWDTGAVLGATTIDNAGSFSVPITIPANASPGPHQIKYFAVESRFFVVSTFTVINGSPPPPPPQQQPSLTVGTSYAANSEWAGATIFAPGDIIRYQTNLTASAALTLNARTRVVGPGGRVILDSGNDVRVDPSHGSVFIESTIPADAPAGTYTQTATVVYNGESSVRTNTFEVRAPQQSPPPSSPPALDEKDCNIDVRATATTFGDIGLGIGQHLYIVYTDPADSEYNYEALPSGFRSPTGTIKSDNDAGSDSKAGIKIAGPTTVLSGPDACGRNSAGEAIAGFGQEVVDGPHRCFLDQSARIDRASIQYVVLEKNSNAFVYTLLVNCGITPKKPKEANFTPGFAEQWQLIVNEAPPPRA